MFAQREIPKIQPYVDWRMFHLGFYLGLHCQDLIITHSGATTEGNWFAEIPSYSPGFSVGIVGDMFVNPYLNLRVLPSLHFGDKSFVFRNYETADIYRTDVRSNYLSFPLELKYSSFRVNNYRPYLTSGVYGAFDLGRKKGEAILLKSFDYGVTIGLGCDFYFSFFKFCPELKFYFGLADLIEKTRSDLAQPELGIYQDALHKATSRMIILTINFE
ncbi:MAG: PorT family protein [Tannerellaceae bacterium]|jgi:hypothetical protein|nr:PorT family protein [Tannerellaceae bacterium]